MMREQLVASGLPIGGFICAAQRQGHALVPSVRAGAVPSAHVTHAARIASEIAHDLRRGSFDDANVSARVLREASADDGVPQRAMHAARTGGEHQAPAPRARVDAR